jgi:hypothetical protein
MEFASFQERPRIVRWIDDSSSFTLTRFCLLRLLGFVYFIAFLSTVVQGPSLIGEHGLSPMSGLLACVARVTGSRCPAS